MGRKQYIVIGLGRFGTSVAESLTSLGNDVLAIDIKEENARHISDRVSHVIQADIKNEDIVETLGLKDFDAAIVAIGEDVEASCMAIIALKKQGVNHIIAKAKSHNSGKILKAVGADKVIYPERDMGLRVAHNIFSSNVIDFLEFSKEHSIVEVYAPSWTIGKTIEELHIRDKYHVNIVAIRNNENTNVDVQGSTIIKEKDILIIIGKDKNISDFK